MITYDITPRQYRCWGLTIDPPVATLILGGGQDDGGDGRDADDGPGSELSVLLRADIELSDALQRLRFEYPDVAVVVVTGGTDQAFCRGIAEIPPGSAPHIATNARAFRNEVLCGIEDASVNSGQRWLAALNGSAVGPGYELALATDEIVLLEDDRCAVALAGDCTAGALARLVDKRRVRPDLIDAFCCRPEGLSGQRAAEWGLVDVVVTASRFEEVVGDRARAARHTPRGTLAESVELGTLWREDFDGGFAYPNLRVDFHESATAATLTICGPSNRECFAPEPGPRRLRSHWWPLAVCREIDDALLLLRSNWPEVLTLVVRTEGDPLAVASADVALTSGYENDWFVREVVLSWKRALKRLDFAWQSVVALVEPGSCFVGTLFELALASDRIYMVDTAPDGAGEPPAQILLTSINFGPLPQASGLTRLEARFLTQPEHLAALAQKVGDPISATEAVKLGLVTDIFAAPEWDESIHRAIEERAGLAFDAREGLTAARHAAGAATLETKILGRHASSGASR